MRHPTRLVCVLLTAAVVTCGCGSAAHPGSASAGSAQAPSLATSLGTPTGTWAVAVLGGSAASHNNFWQLFTRPATTSTWHLATPPGVASNGGLVLAAPGTGPVVAGFRPSQDLASSPLAITHDNGASWVPAILDAGLADVPDALAAAPSGGRLLALLTNGTIKLSTPGATGWTTLATHRALAASAAATRCRPGNLIAAAFSPSGTPLLAADCTRPGAAGIFAYTHQTWHPAAPALPAPYDRQNVTVLRLTTTTGITTALLAAGSGPATHLLAAWSTDNAAHWSLSQPLPLRRAKVISTSFGPSGAAAITLTGNHAQTTSPAARFWQPLPALPSATATLAPGPKSGWEALTIHRTKLTIWQLAPGVRTWASTQVITAPIQFGSSG
jgi:hypothetical protein